MNTDWPATDYAQKLVKDDYKLAVPLTLLYLTPPAVAFIGKVLSQCSQIIVSGSNDELNA